MGSPVWTDAITPAEWQAMWLSLRVAFFATLCSLPLAIWCAVILERRVFWGRALLSALIYLPLVLPPVVTGYLLLVTFGPAGPVGSILKSWGITLAFTPAGAALAAAVLTRQPLCLL